MAWRAICRKRGATARMARERAANVLAAASSSRLRARMRPMARPLLCI